MNFDLRELYQEMILDHNKNPHHHYKMPNSSLDAQGFNPICGDKVTVYLKVIDKTISEISFIGCGCAISQASASMMTDSLTNKTIEEAHELFKNFTAMLTKDQMPFTPSDPLAILCGVKTYPARVKCATLAWHTLEAALNKKVAPVSTEEL